MDQNDSATCQISRYSQFMFVDSPMSLKNTIEELKRFDRAIEHNRHDQRNDNIDLQSQGQLQAYRDLCDEMRNTNGNDVAVVEEKARRSIVNAEAFLAQVATIERRAVEELNLKKRDGEDHGCSGPRQWAVGRTFYCW